MKPLILFHFPWIRLRRSRPGKVFLSPVDGGSAQGTNTYMFQFDLTAPSLVQLTGSADSLQQASGLGPLLSETVAFSLTGPGFDLDSTSPSSPVYYPCQAACGGIPFSFNDTFSLAPGVYTLTASDDASDFAAIALSVENTQDLSLQLDFTQIPEPRWTAIILLPLLMTTGWAVRRIATS